MSFVRSKPSAARLLRWSLSGPISGPSTTLVDFQGLDERRILHNVVPHSQALRDQRETHGRAFSADRGTGSTAA